MRSQKTISITIAPHIVALWTLPTVQTMITAAAYVEELLQAQEKEGKPSHGLDCSDVGWQLDLAFTGCFLRSVLNIRSC